MIGTLVGGGLLVSTVSQLEPLPWVIVAAALVAIVSFFDDRSGLPVAVRFIVHVVAALVLLLGGVLPSELVLPGTVWVWPASVAGFVCFLFVVWMINLYNFMDGMDGFAGGMAVIGFGAFGCLGWLAGDFPFASTSFVVMAAAGGFLISNFPPARIFMGDTGSSALGLLAGALTLWAARDGIFPLWIGLLIFSPFIVDATTTLLRRVVRRAKIWTAHKTHYYQRLVQLGWGHKTTVLREYMLMFVCAFSAVVGSRQTPTVQWGIIVFWIAAYATLIWVVEFMDRRAQQARTA